MTDKHIKFKNMNFQSLSKKENMKKIQILILCGMLFFGVTACESNQVIQENKVGANSSENELLESNGETLLAETETPVDETAQDEVTEDEVVQEEVVEEIYRIDSEENVWVEGPVVLRGATFCPPLTRTEAENLGIEYDGLCEVNGVCFVTYDWVAGDDGMEEDLPDSDMTVDSYALAMGGHAASEEELKYLMSQFPVLDPEYGFGWPTTYWLGEWWGDRESGEDANPLLYNLEWYWEGEGSAYDFSPFNLPVIVVVGEMYEPDYTGVMEMREKEFEEDGSGYFVNMLWDVKNETEEIRTIYTNEHTLVFDEYGYLVDVNSLVSSQLSIEIVMDEAGEFAEKIYILPFRM